MTTRSPPYPAVGPLRYESTTPNHDKASEEKYGKFHERITDHPSTCLIPGLRLPKFIALLIALLQIIVTQHCSRLFVAPLAQRATLLRKFVLNKVLDTHVVAVAKPSRTQQPQGASDNTKPSPARRFCGVIQFIVSLSIARMGLSLSCAVPSEHRAAAWQPSGYERRRDDRVRRYRKRNCAAQESLRIGYD